MARVSFTQNVQRHVACPTEEVPGATLREVLDAVFSGNPQGRGYFLDDQGALHPHVVVFIDGRQARDRQDLSDELGPDADVHVMQALSGG